MYIYMYSIFNFSNWQTPAGVTCPGRKLTRPFPTVAKDAFSFTTEIVDVDDDDIAYMKVIINTFSCQKANEITIQ